MRFSTSKVAPHERFAYWREAVCESYVRLGCDTERRGEEFDGEIAIARYSNLAISQVAGVSHSVIRRQQDIRADSQSSYILSIQSSHTSRISQFGHTAVLQPGDMAIYDSTHPYQLDLSDGFAQTVLQFPKERILARLPDAPLLGGIRIDGNTEICRLARENILQLTDQMDRHGALVSGLLEETVMDLVAIALASRLQQAVDLSSPEQHVLLQARAYIGAHLNDPDLNREKVARSVGLSVRRLNDVFGKQNTSIARDIREKRLDAVASDLSDIRFAGLSISEIAMKRGFSNLQHFSTLFRKTYDCSPKEYRSNSTELVVRAEGP